MSLLRFLGLTSLASDAPGPGETQTVRQIAAKLDGLDPERARFLAAFAYVLARVAHADLNLDAEEVREMERQIEALAELGPDDAEIVVAIAQTQAQTLGGTENYRVTREFRRIATHAERVRLLECLYAVAAADGEISTTESTEIAAIADELGFTRRELNALRAHWRDHLAELNPTLTPK